MPTTTFSVAASGDDGYVGKAQTVWPPTATTETITDATIVDVRKHVDSGGSYRNRIGLIRWDTSALADTTILSAVFRFKGSSIIDADGRNFDGEYYASSNWPIDVEGDYTLDVGTGAFTVDITTLTQGADNDIPLTNPDANISKSGYTGLRLGISTGQPAGYNVVALDSFDAGANVPRLVVNWTTMSSARGQGSVLSY